MRGALSSLLEWPSRLGGWLLTIISNLFLTSLLNQKSNRYNHAEDRLFIGPDCGFMDCCPKRVLGKRKRGWLCEDDNPASEFMLSRSSSAKRRRSVRLQEWRFWLPSTSDLVGDESLLSRADGFTDDIDDPNWRDHAQVGLVDRDFDKEAVEVRSLVIKRQWRSFLAGAAERSIGDPPCLSTWAGSSQSRELGNNCVLENVSELHSPSISGLLGGFQGIPAQRGKSDLFPTLIENPNPIYLPTLIQNTPLKLGFYRGLGPLYIPSPPGRARLPIHQPRRPGKPATVGTLALVPSLWSCSGHARRDCTFDPPRGKERFGPHMATKKVGRKLYEEDGDAPQFGGPRRSVWINRQNQNNMVAGRNESSVGARSHTQTSVQLEQSAPLKTSLGSASRGGMGLHQVKGSGRSPKARGSPRGFALNRPPKLRLGSSQQRHPAGKKPEAGHGPPVVVVADQSRPALVGRQDPGPKSSGASFATIQEESRCRRLILEEDSDDDMVDVHPAAAQATVQQPMLNGSSTVQAAHSSPTAAGMEKAVTRRSRRSKLQPLKKMVQEVAPQDGVAAAAGLVQSQPGNLRGGRKLRKAKACVEDKATVEAASPRDGVILASLNSDEVAMNPPAIILGEDMITTAMKDGDEVVEPFMAGSTGCVIEPQISPQDRGIGVVDEYGSNMLNPPPGLKKLPLEVIEGEVGVPPTPKKQFVEEGDALEKVEEASLEWLQPDK
ncbi:unnamed protein product [Linum trigynum]|uniref:Uncharacterized protein n=1 Tax=Linum trigynum TaxID=586398 RepID=A0AAV2FEC0_9ROSI